MRKLELKSNFWYENQKKKTSGEHKMNRQWQLDGYILQVAPRSHWKKIIDKCWAKVGLMKYCVRWKMPSHEIGLAPTAPIKGWEIVLEKELWDFSHNTPIRRIKYFVRPADVKGKIKLKPFTEIGWQILDSK